MNLFRKPTDRYVLTVIILFTVACFFTYWGSYPLRYVINVALNIRTKVFLINRYEPMFLEALCHLFFLQICRKFARKRVLNSLQNLGISFWPRHNRVLPVRKLDVKI